MNRGVILFVSEAQNASPTRYRATAYFDLLRAAGWTPRHIAVTGGWRRAALLLAVRQAKVVVILRKTFSPAFCHLLRSKNRRLIFDFDDAIFTRDDGQSDPVKNLRFEAMARSVDAVWAGNSYLAQQARAAGAPTTVLPTSINPAHYPVNAAATGDTFDVVWIGSSSTRKYLANALGPLQHAARAIPELRLKIVADFDFSPAEKANLKTAPIRWSAATEAAALASAHVGIAPLPDDPWTRGKCGLKILQYMAAGLPVIASDVGVHSDLVTPETTGILVPHTKDAWLTALMHLRTDVALRRAMGIAGRNRAFENYSIATTFLKMQATLESLH